MKTSFDKNAEKIVDLVVKKIESLTIDWSKPWFPKLNSTQNFLPQNLSGRVYSGGNAFLLFFLCEKCNYQFPVFLTFKQAQDEGIHILKGAKAFPVYYPVFCAYHCDTNEKISFDEYKKLTKEEQLEYRLSSYNQYYAVFNLDQTNFSEIYPDRWDDLKDKFKSNDILTAQEGMYENLILDDMLNKQNWVCPIKSVSSDSAYYSINSDNITLPLKSQFKSGESFYCTELHEMAHSTGIRERLNRKGFYDNDTLNYGREELVAELTVALAALHFGISTTIREENAAYLKCWCKEIKEEPKFLFKVLSDAIKATKFIADELKISFVEEEIKQQRTA